MLFSSFFLELTKEFKISIGFSINVRLQLCYLQWLRYDDNVWNTQIFYIILKWNSHFLDITFFFVKFLLSFTLAETFAQTWVKISILIWLFLLYALRIAVCDFELIQSNSAHWPSILLKDFNVKNFFFQLDLRLNTFHWLVFPLGSFFLLFNLNVCRIVIELPVFSLEHFLFVHWISQESCKHLSSFHKSLPVISF